MTCEDRPGIVQAVATAIADHDGNILESNQFGDPSTGQFFMRVRFHFPDPDAFAFYFKPIATRFSIRAEITKEAEIGRVMILVSKQDHCLVDLLYRQRTGAVPMTVTSIVSNHLDAQDIAQAKGLPYHHLPVTRETKAEQEKALLALVEEERADLVVLARYMQILSDRTANALFGKAINIHHSFLPSFKGAKPYHQAFDRGVKLIGATAHYVTPDLDEGPIIEQAVERVTHSDSPQALTRMGREIEARVLARAVKWHLESRVLLNGTKTVVFP
ncbi:MAG: formyltetrahydrofolate deformylase [Rhodospirillaceae bacterium]